MALRLASLTSASALRSSALIWRLSEDSMASSSVQSGQRLAKPGLSGLSSNSSPQIAHTLTGKGIYKNDKP